MARRTWHSIGIKPPNTKAWTRADESSVGLKIAFMVETEHSNGRSEDENQIPDNMRYSRPLPRTFDLERYPSRSTSATTQELLHPFAQSVQQSSPWPETRLQDGVTKLNRPAAETTRVTTAHKRTYDESESSDAVSVALVVLRIY